MYACPIRLYCSEQDRNAPVKFSTSQAAKCRAEYTRSGSSGTRVPVAQPYIINLSLVVFMLYFCILREENDIDVQLSGNLYKKVPGLEEANLKLAIEYNESHGLDTIELQKRLDEITKK